MIYMEINFEYLVGDDVIVKSSNEPCKIEQRKVTILEYGKSSNVREEYYVKYKNKPYYQGIWVANSDLVLARVEDELSIEAEYYRLTALIDTYLSKERLNLELVKKYWDERDALGKK